MMVEDARSSARMARNDVIRIEPGHRLVVLARTLQAPSLGPEAAWSDAAAPSGLGEACLGRALYRHGSVVRSASDMPVWSHLELSYFRDVVPADVVRDRVFAPRPGGPHLLRAEILLTTPSSFAMPPDWRGSAGRPRLRASLEYIHVRPARLGEYRDVMRRYIGPAAARLVASGAFGTYRAMETAAVLHQDPSLNTDWNQIHLCEVEPDGFEGFGPAFDAALGEIAPDGGYAGVFAGLGPLRTIPRWTFNDAVVEADLAVGQVGSAMPPMG